MFLARSLLMAFGAMSGLILATPSWAQDA